MFVLRKCLVALYFFNYVSACWIWASFSKHDSGFADFPEHEKLILYQQLDNLYDQSYYAPDGWAIAGINTSTDINSGILIRSETAAYIDSASYWDTVDSLFESYNGKIGLAHLRAASSGATGIPNPHPWVFDDGDQLYYLVHNGTVNKEILYNLITSNGSDMSWLYNHPPQTFIPDNWDSSIGWQNVVDSELILLLIMKKISENDDILTGIQIALELIINSGVFPGQLNIVFSNSSELYIFGGQNGLSISEFENHFSIMTEPPNSDDSGNYSWDGLDGDELLVISSSGIDYYSNFFSLSDGELLIPEESFLFPSYPNPFNGSLFIPYQIIGSQSSVITIRNIMGKIIYKKKILPKQSLDKGVIEWRAINSRDHSLASGTYIIGLESGNKVDYQKISFIK